MNSRKRDVTIIVVMTTTLAVIFVTAMANTNNVWAAIRCPNVPGTNQCNGTNQPDNILGSANADVIKGYDDDDRISGSEGKDDITAGLGADTTKGGAGDDRLYHNQNDVFASFTSPDGSEDKIDCGGGNDIVWINTLPDHDIAAKNCETVHG